MSVQVFLQGKLLGIESFVLAPQADGSASDEALVLGRAHWVTLLAEVLPRSLLADLGLARILLGSSGGGSFLLVLPVESLPAAEEFLRRASAGVSALSAGRLKLVWASTENLGDWTIVRKRLAEAMFRQQHTAPVTPEAFLPHEPVAVAPPEEYFTDVLAPRFRGAKSVGCNPDQPARILLDEGAYTWPLDGSADSIVLARHAAPEEDGTAAPVSRLGSRAAGRPAWGVLRGDVDGFGVRLRRSTTIEEHVQLSVLFKQFFAGELEVQCSMPDYWRKVTILYTGGDDFAVYGAWDALLQLAREMQRLFHRFVEANLAELPGPEGKTITMALELAPEPDSPFAYVYEAANRSVEAAKCVGKDCFSLFGRTVEWRHLQHAGELKDIMLRMVRDFGCPPQFLEELSGFYRDKIVPSARPDRPWRYHRRVALVLGSQSGPAGGTRGRAQSLEDRELHRLRSALITDIVGKGQAQVKLRPVGRVAVEWARLLMEA